MALTINPLGPPFDFTGSSGGGGTGTVTNIATTAPITGGPITTTGTIAITDAAADGTTKGAAAFTAADFNATSGVVSLDYANGQKATGSQAGFLSSTDWTTFNNKGSGTVASVALTVPSFLSVAGSPITTSGTLAVTLQTETANTVFAGPTTGAAATPTFRALVSGDFPELAPLTLTTSNAHPGITLTLNQNETGPGADNVLNINTVNDSPYGVMFTNATGPVSFGMYLGNDGVEHFDSALSLSVDMPLAVGGNIFALGSVSNAANANFGVIAQFILSADGLNESGGNASIIDSNGKNNSLDIYAYWSSPRATGASTLTKLTGLYIQPQVNNTATVTNVFGAYFNPTAKAAGATLTTAMAFYSADLAGYGTNPYYLWADSQGVYRIREDNVADSGSFPQAVTALYNPRFTKYTPGLANYERIVQQWVGNVATLTTEAGGAGTLRAMNLGAASVQVQVNGKNLTLAGDLTTAGAFASTFTMTGATGVTFPTSGTLATTSQLPSAAALSKADDTNVTLALTGTPTTALLQATTITAGWTGTLSVARGGSGAGTLTGLVVGNGTSAFTTVTAPSGTVVGTTDTQTLTNKRVNPRTDTVTSSATPTINTDTTDEFTITALAAAITSMTTNLSGTPVNGQRLIVRILDNGTARAITWGASFAARGVALPTTTVISKYLYVGFLWNSTTTTWDCVASAQET